MKLKAKGTICGVIAAVSYGTNPLGALSLYQEGIQVNSVLFFRYSLAALVLLVLLFVRKESLRLAKAELKILSLLGLLFASSSITLFTSFHYIDAGVASTLLFVYPILVVVLMALFFKEKITLTTLASVSLALMGIAMLSKSPDGAILSTVGIILVFVSALTYAIYIIIVNKATLNMSVYKLTFYVLVFCDLTIVSYALLGGGAPLQMLTTWRAWGYAWMLALVPTIISLVTMAVAVQEIGSTPTAIMGALEPLTAVVIGVSLFGEELTLPLGLGILMILISVLLIIAGKAISFKALSSQLALLRSRKWKI